MSKLRSIDTRIWSDTWFENTTSNQKLIFIYLLTNDKTNMLGIYEVSERKIAFDTGISVPDVKKCIAFLEEKGKIKYIDKYIILVNFLKYQKFNPNMKKSAIDTFNSLPDALKNGKVLDKSDLTNAWETLCKWLSNGLGMLSKVEVEYEEEEETKKEIYKYDFFYDSQLFENDELKKDLHPHYLNFVKFIFGEDQLHSKMKGILSMNEQLTNEMFSNLYAKAKSNDKTISELLTSLENGKYYKSRTSLYKTLLTWINR